MQEKPCDELVEKIYDLINPNGYDDFDTDQVQEDAENIANLFRQLLDERLKEAHEVIDWYDRKTPISAIGVYEIEIPNGIGKFATMRKARDYITKHKLD